LERISDSRLYCKLLNHNAWTNGTILDINSLGAGGSRNHLILANTQTKLGDLMTNSQLWDLIQSIGTFENSNGLQRENEPLKKFIDEYTRLDKGGKVETSFIQETVQWIKSELVPVRGTDFGEGDF